MNTLSLALRNLLRNRRRSIATILALAIGAASVLLFGGYSTDIRYTLLTDYVQSGGHIRVQHQDFQLFGNGNPTEYAVGNYRRIMQAIESDPELQGRVRLVSPMLQFNGLAGNQVAGVSRPVLGLGFIAEDVARMRQWNEYGLPPIYGPYSLLNTNADAAVVGVGVARVLLLCEQLKVADCPRPQQARPALQGDRGALPDDVASLAADEGQSRGAGRSRSDHPVIDLLATQPRGAPNVTPLTVIAAESQGFKELDEVTVKLHLAQAQQLIYGKTEPRVTAIMVQLERTDDIPLAASRLRVLLPQSFPGQPLAVLDFEQMNPFYGETIALFRTIFGFIFVLIGGIVLFTVGNTMMAAVMERTNEIGTTRAVGVKRAGVRKLFVAEGFLLGCVGASLGVLSAVLLSVIINGLNLSWYPPGASGPLPLTVRVIDQTLLIAGTALSLVAVATASAWLPAWRAARLSIVDALRHT